MEHQAGWPQGAWRSCCEACAGHLGRSLRSHALSALLPSVRLFIQLPSWVGGGSRALLLSCSSEAGSSVPLTSDLSRPVLSPSLSRPAKAVCSLCRHSLADKALALQGFAGILLASHLGFPVAGSRRCATTPLCGGSVLALWPHCSCPLGSPPGLWRHPTRVLSIF